MVGDLERDFMENVKDEISFLLVDVVFTPHHGRKSGRLPKSVLDKLTPHIIVVGEDSSVDLTYYSDYNTIAQNTSGDITFYCDGSKVKVYVENCTYSVRFLTNEYCADTYRNYIGTLTL